MHPQFSPNTQRPYKCSLSLQSSLQHWTINSSCLHYSIKALFSQASSLTNISSILRLGKTIHICLHQPRFSVPRVKAQDPWNQRHAGVLATGLNLGSHKDHMHFCLLVAYGSKSLPSWDISTLHSKVSVNINYFLLFWACSWLIFVCIRDCWLLSFHHMRVSVSISRIMERNTFSGQLTQPSQFKQGHTKITI